MNAKIIFITYLIIAAVAAIWSYNAWLANASVSFTVFQAVFLLLVGLCKFPWREFLGLDMVEVARSRKSSATATFSRACCKPKAGALEVWSIPVPEILGNNTGLS